MNLAPYTAKGFPGNWDQLLQETPVGGIDREQTRHAVRLCAETEAFIYGPDFSPRKIRYRSGSRPKLEEIVNAFKGKTPRERALAAMQWVYDRMQHPHVCGMLAPDRAMSEEDLIESGRGWCNEQSRVFIALCEVMEIPARLCFLFHANQKASHATTEAFVDHHWVFFDISFNLVVNKPDGSLAEARELSGKLRPLAHAAYRQPLADLYGRTLPAFKDVPGWGLKDRPQVERGGDLLDVLGFCNYLIEGVECA